MFPDIGLERNDFEAGAEGDAPFDRKSAVRDAASRSPAVRPPPWAAGCAGHASSPSS